MASGTDLDQFDLLGVGGREDSYSDLLGHAFLASAAFRDRFLRALPGLETAGDGEGWEALVRPGSGPIDLACCDGPPVGADRRRDIPDLVFYNRRSGTIVAIDNDLFTPEASDRSERYASLTQRAGLSEMLGLENPSFHFYQLSLRERRPASPAFRAISYRSLLEDVLASLALDPGDPLDGLLLALRDRLSEYYSRRPPARGDPLKAHLRYRRRLVFSYRNFEVFAADLFAGYQTDGDVTSNMDCCFIPLYRAWKIGWLAQPELASAAGDCYSAHYELQWNTRLDRLTLYFHVETDPWRAGSAPLCVLRDIGASTVARFQDWRGRLYAQLTSHQAQLEAAGWSVRRSFAALMSAHLPVTDLVTAGEAGDKIRGLLAVATPLVDGMVAGAAEQPGYFPILSP